MKAIHHKIASVSLSVLPTIFFIASVFLATKAPELLFKKHGALIEDTSPAFYITLIPLMLIAYKAAKWVDKLSWNHQMQWLIKNKQAGSVK